MSNHFGSYGDNFQQQSKYIRGNLPEHLLDWAKKPKTYKSYPNAIKIIQLPDPEFDKKVSFWDVVLKRHSTRKYSSEPINLSQISSLLFGITGLTRVFPHYAFRTVPSAGGLYPIEVYPIVNNIENLEEGM